jgi:hypothetical protein
MRHPFHNDLRDPTRVQRVPGVNIHLLPEGLYPYLVIVGSLWSECKSEVMQVYNAYADFFLDNGIAVENGHIYDSWDEAESRRKAVYARLEPQFEEPRIGSVFSLARNVFVWLIARRKSSLPVWSVL